nr:hypothetical protein [Tanacetum cinerariifolium]
MGDENPIRTLGDYFKPSHEGYRNTIELHVGNNMNVNSISLTRGEEERSEKTEVTAGDDFEKPTKTETKMPVKEAEKEEEAENEPNRLARKEETTEAPSSQPVKYYLKLKIREKLIEGPVDIKEDEKRPFILGTPFLTTAKAIIKFDKGTITPRSGKKQPIHVLPVPPEGQANPPNVVTKHQAWVKARKEIAGLMLMTMDPEIQKTLEHLGAYDMLNELKTLYVQQADHQLF